MGSEVTKFHTYSPYHVSTQVKERETLMCLRPPFFLSLFCLLKRNMYFFLCFI